MWSSKYCVDVCGSLVTMYEGGVEDVDGVYGKTLCIKLQDKTLHEFWYVHCFMAFHVFPAVYSDNYFNGISVVPYCIF